jgi:hypothetical protein
MRAQRVGSWVRAILRASEPRGLWPKHGPNANTTAAAAGAWASRSLARNPFIHAG